MKEKITGYCLRCKKAVEIENPSEFKTKNGKKIIKGLCPVCKIKVCRIGK